MQVCQSVRSSALFDNEDCDLIRMRMEKRRENAIKAIESLKRFLSSEPQPRTRREFERFAVRIEAAHALVSEAGALDAN